MSFISQQKQEHDEIRTIRVYYTKADKNQPESGGLFHHAVYDIAKTTDIIDKNTFLPMCVQYNNVKFKDYSLVVKDLKHAEKMFVDLAFCFCDKVIVDKNQLNVENQDVILSIFMAKESNTIARDTRRSGANTMIVNPYTLVGSKYNSLYHIITCRHVPVNCFIIMYTSSNGDSPVHFIETDKNYLYLLHDDINAVCDWKKYIRIISIE